jgi:hypothetical protein
VTLRLSLSTSTTPIRQLSLIGSLAQPPAPAFQFPIALTIVVAVIVIIAIVVLGVVQRNRKRT